MRAFRRAIAGQHQDRRDAGRQGGADIGSLVADQPAVFQVQAEIALRGLPQTRRGFAALAFARFAVRGVMRTMVIGIDVRTLAGKPPIDLGMQPVHRRLVVIAARHTGLIGDDDGEMAHTVDLPNRLDGAGNPFPVFDTIQVFLLDIDGTVPVEKHGAPTPHAVLLAPAA